jgi:hypothetical protein
VKKVVAMCILLYLYDELMRVSPTSFSKHVTMRFCTVGVTSDALDTKGFFQSFLDS